VLFLVDQIIFIVMSHLRDIQKLRQTRNPGSNPPFTHRFSQQQPSTPDIYTPSF